MPTGQVHIDYIWGASIAEICLQMMIKLWELRHKEVHGKEKGEIQQRRKENSAVSVQNLHKKQSQSRPSDRRK